MDDENLEDLFRRQERYCLHVPLWPIFKEDITVKDGDLLEMVGGGSETTEVMMNVIGQALLASDSLHAVIVDFSYTIDITRFRNIIYQIASHQDSLSDAKALCANVLARVHYYSIRNEENTLSTIHSLHTFLCSPEGSLVRICCLQNIGAFQDMGRQNDSSYPLQAFSLLRRILEVSPLVLLATRISSSPQKNFTIPGWNLIREKRRKRGRLTVRNRTTPLFSHTSGDCVQMDSSPDRVLKPGIVSRLDVVIEWENVAGTMCLACLSSGCALYEGFQWD
eukprot:Rmarinus@m.3051